MVHKSFSPSKVSCYVYMYMCDMSMGKQPQGWEVPMCPTYHAGKTDDLMACMVLLRALVSGAPSYISKIIEFSFNALGPQFFFFFPLILLILPIYFIVHLFLAISEPCISDCTCMLILHIFFKQL